MFISTSKLVKFIPKKAIFKASRQILTLKKNSPHIFFVGGLAGSITSTVMACRATLKLSETLDEIKKEVNDVSIMKVDDDERYPSQEWRRDMAYVYSKASLKIVRLYGPSFLVGVVSVSALTGSHIQLARRNTALMAAYAAMQQAFEEYRNRVRDAIGESKELDIYHSAKTEIVKIDGKNEAVKVIDPNKLSAYARFFDEYSRFWVRDPELNRIYVQCQQNFANDLLRARGHVFLNEVYDMLGINRSTAGQIVGWVINDEGDNYVNFHIFEAFNSAFVNGHEQSVLLDFNVDGVVYDKI